MEENTLKKKIIEKLTLVKTKALELWLSLSPNLRKLLTVIAIVFSVMILLIILTAIIVGLAKRSKKPFIRPTLPPAASVLPSPGAISNPSRYATDSAVLKIESDLPIVQGRLDNLQVSEVDLLPPRLDFDINFRE